MGHEVLNLNKPPTEGELCHYVILKKDDQTISRVQCLNPPAEAYKRVGGMVHNADMGRGVIDVVDLMYRMIGMARCGYIATNKVVKTEPYAKLEDWLGNKSDEHWDADFDALQLAKGDARYMPDHEWVQCDKCRKWRILNNGFDSESLPVVWCRFCYMPPFNGECRIPEQKVGRGIVILASKHGHGPHQKPVQLEEGATVAKRSRRGPNQVFRCEEAAKGASNFPVGAGDSGGQGRPGISRYERT